MFGGEIPSTTHLAQDGHLAVRGAPRSPQQEEAIRWNSKLRRAASSHDIGTLASDNDGDESLGDLSQFDFKKRIDDAVLGSMDRQYLELQDRVEAAEHSQSKLAKEKGRVTDEMSSIRKENESLRAQMTRMEENLRKAEHEKLIALSEKDLVERRMLAISKREKQLSVDNDKLSADNFQATQGGKSLQFAAQALQNDIKIRDQVESSLKIKIATLEKDLAATKAIVATKEAKCNEVGNQKLEVEQKVKAQENETAKAQREVERLVDELCKVVEENVKLKSQWENFTVAMGKRDESMHALWKAKEKEKAEGLVHESISKQLETVVAAQTNDISKATEEVKQIRKDRDKCTETLVEMKNRNEKLTKDLELSRGLATKLMNELVSARDEMLKLQAKFERLETFSKEKEAMVGIEKQAVSNLKMELDALWGPLSDANLDRNAGQIRDLQTTIIEISNQKQELSLKSQAQDMALQEIQNEFKRVKDTNKTLTEERNKMEATAFNLKNSLHRSEYSVLKAQAKIYDDSKSASKDGLAVAYGTVKCLQESEKSMAKERNDAYSQIISSDIKSKHTSLKIQHQQNQIDILSEQKISALQMKNRLLSDIENLETTSLLQNKNYDLSKVKLRNVTQKVGALFRHHACR
jgi:chromosome segregation ATPase